MVDLYNGDRLCFLFDTSETEETFKSLNITIKHDRKQMSLFTLCEPLRDIVFDRI